MEDNQTKANKLWKIIMIGGSLAIAICFLIVALLGEQAPFRILVPLLTVFWLVWVVLIVKYLVLIFRR